MIPKSALEKVLLSSCLFPLYINRAVNEKNPVERVIILKNIILVKINYMCHSWKFLFEL